MSSSACLPKRGPGRQSRLTGQRILANGFSGLPVKALADAVMPRYGAATVCHCWPWRVRPLWWQCCLSCCTATSTTARKRGVRRARRTVNLMFLLAISSLWFGCNNAAKEIVKERTYTHVSGTSICSPAVTMLSKLLLLTIFSWVRLRFCSYRRESGWRRWLAPGLPEPSETSQCRIHR